MTVEDIMTLIRNMADETVIRKAIEEVLNEEFNKGYDDGAIAASDDL